MLINRGYDPQNTKCYDQFKKLGRYEVIFSSPREAMVKLLDGRIVWLMLSNTYIDDFTIYVSLYTIKESLFHV